MFTVWHSTTKLWALLYAWHQGYFFSQLIPFRLLHSQRVVACSVCSIRAFTGRYSSCLIKPTRYVFIFTLHLCKKEIICKMAAFEGSMVFKAYISQIYYASDFFCSLCSRNGCLGSNIEAFRWARMVASNRRASWGHSFDSWRRWCSDGSWNGEWQNRYLMCL